MQNRSARIFLSSTFRDFHDERRLLVQEVFLTLRERLRAHSYLLVGEHGCYGDQLWVHASFASQVERVLQLPQPLSPTRDAGRELWFANCSVRGSPAEHALHAHMTSINS